MWCGTLVCLARFDLLQNGATESKSATNCQREAAGERWTRRESGKRDRQNRARNEGRKGEGEGKAGKIRREEMRRVIKRAGERINGRLEGK